MRPPKVPRKLWEGRQPLGVIINSLPSLYLAHRENGDWLLMKDGTVSEATGSQICLAIIAPETMQTLLGRSQTPYRLIVAPEGV